jgi:WS/DGAT/MGAT family acyltransferase
VLDLAAEEAAAAFDPARPPWQAIVARGFDDEQAVLMLRFHHSLTDGVGGIDLAHQLFQPMGPISNEVAEVAESAARRRPDLIDRALGLVGAVGSTVADPVGAVRGSLRTARSVSRLLAPAKEPLSPLLDGRSIDRHLHVFDLPLDAFRDAATACDATINDVFLGAVGGAVRAYHDHAGTPVHALRFTMPVNRRSAEDAPGGNRFTPVRFVLEVDGADLAGRARRAGAVSRGWKRDPSLGFTDVLAAALNRLPDQAVIAAFSGMLRSVDIDAVDVPGLADPVSLAGAPLERLWAFAPLAGAALSVTLLSHVDRACVALECDTAAVHEPARLAAYLTNALDEVVDLATGGIGGTP